MFLYRLEVRYTDNTRTELVILHEDEEKVFQTAQSQIDRHYLPPKKVEELVIVEKKPAGAGRGYVIDI
ncbi:DUF3906 family protein [Aneurinibacillus terranovensis]|uniref:DUF3906 family protein n=1 Tax=Aneurinibacillus terranovensis TaxID=278991 RepID=UPI0003F58880|nr:DUF3906 family protein [Aneurinibacillus terranovensis]